MLVKSYVTVVDSAEATKNESLGIESASLEWVSPLVFDISKVESARDNTTAVNGEEGVPAVTAYFDSGEFYVLLADFADFTKVWSGLVDGHITELPCTVDPQDYPRPY